MEPNVRPYKQFHVLVCVARFHCPLRSPWLRALFGDVSFKLQHPRLSEMTLPLGDSGRPRRGSLEFELPQVTRTRRSPNQRRDTGVDGSASY
eukprot:2517167-Prymnesium_polylepis.1